MNAVTIPVSHMWGAQSKNISRPFFRHRCAGLSRHERGYLKTPRAPGSPAALKISCPSHSSAFPGTTGYSLVSVLATDVFKKRNKPWLAASTSSFGGTEGELLGSSVGGVYFVFTFPTLLSSTRPAGRQTSCTSQACQGVDPGSDKSCHVKVGSHLYSTKPLPKGN